MLFSCQCQEAVTLLSSQRRRNKQGGICWNLPHVRDKARRILGPIRLGDPKIGSTCWCNWVACLQTPPRSVDVFKDRQSKHGPQQLIAHACRTVLQLWCQTCGYPVLSGKGNTTEPSPSAILFWWLSGFPFMAPRAAFADTAIVYWCWIVLAFGEKTPNKYVFFILILVFVLSELATVARPRLVEAPPKAEEEHPVATRAQVGCHTMSMWLSFIFVWRERLVTHIERLSTRPMAIGGVQIHFDHQCGRRFT